jgi:hypothetical protein
MNPIRRRRLLIFWSLIPLIVGCNPPSFKGGVRDVAYETLIGVTADIPVTNVLDFGNATSGGTNNGQTAFEGVTGSFGIDDHPLAAVGTNWTVTFNYVAAIPDCGQKTISAFIPSAGGGFTAVCYVESTLQ